MFVLLILIFLPNKRTYNCIHFPPNPLFYFSLGLHEILSWICTIFGNPFTCWWTSRLVYFLAVWDCIAVNMDNQLFLLFIGFGNLREIYVVQLGHMVVLFSILGISTPTSIVAVPIHLCMENMGFSFPTSSS